jgi:1,4-alpha-glucan branching enzyme
MNAVYEKSERSPYSARNMAKPVNFHFAGAEANSVYLSGDFNDWNPTSHPMERHEDGWWSLQVQLTHGHQLYYFVADGKPALDPHAMGKTINEHGEAASLVAVS